MCCAGRTGSTCPDGGGRPRAARPGTRARGRGHPRRCGSRRFRRWTGSGHRRRLRRHRCRCRCRRGRGRSGPRPSLDESPRVLLRRALVTGRDAIRAGDDAAPVPRADHLSRGAADRRPLPSIASTGSAATVRSPNSSVAAAATRPSSASATRSTCESIPGPIASPCRSTVRTPLFRSATSSDPRTVQPSSSLPSYRVPQKTTLPKRSAPGCRSTPASAPTCSGSVAASTWSWPSRSLQMPVIGGGSSPSATATTVARESRNIVVNALKR